MMRQLVRSNIRVHLYVVFVVRDISGVPVLTDTNGSVSLSATNLTVALSVLSPDSVNATALSDCNTLVEIFTTGAVTAFAPLCALGAIVPRAATLGSKAYSAPYIIVYKIVHS